MFRRILCLILVPALLANQAVMCCAHTHTGSEQSDHSTRAHIHQSGHSHDSGHHHHHGDPDDHQHGESSQPQNSNEVLEQSAPISGLETGIPIGHDDDAIYLSDQVDLLVPVSRHSIDEPTVAAAQWLAIDVSTTLRPRHRCQATRAGPLGLFSPDQCSIYLQTCCLLI